MSAEIEGLGPVIADLTSYLAKKDDCILAIAKLAQAAEEFAAAASGSWFGYQSCVYYENFERPPPGASFSKEFGMQNIFGMGTTGHWCEYAFDDVVDLINQEAGNPDLTSAEEFRRDGEKLLDAAKRTVEIELRLFLLHNPDPFIEDLLSKACAVHSLSPDDFRKALIPRGQFQVRDIRAADGRIQTPPHVIIAANCLGYTLPSEAISRLVAIVQQAHAYLTRSRKKMAKDSLVGTNVFIGHGRSAVWRDLKDFVSERLHLPYDEFNRVPVAGITNIARLSEMLDAAAVAFIVMTAEDEQADGKIEARTNVIHEVGLFQGRLGFTRAIVLLEEGCQEFSNIQGLGQIRFPKGDIKSKFEEIRQVLEREKVITS
ncbi:TIR domain-containing protein [Pseudomonas viridiflava]|uniref:TIR domain-containing protein n=1 Tax=Pseudomonas viridiflava TaxID=33069 RepID=UPI000F01CA9E|nr:TIR domain-containing protein [Pseudomonas viridiflava]